MKLVTFSPLPSGEPRPGLVLDDKRIVDIPAALGASDETRTMLGLIRAGDAIKKKLAELAKKQAALADELAKLDAPNQEARRERAEEAATKALGTLVEMDAVRIHTARSTLEVRGLHIADPFDRMKNVVEADRIVFALEPLPLLEKKLVVTPSELVQVIRQVHNGKTRVPPDVAARLAEHMSDEDLTAREVEVLRLLARGWSSKQIAAELTLSPKTVRNHTEHIYTKTGTPNRAAASLFAVQHGLLVD